MAWYEAYAHLARAWKLWENATTKKEKTKVWAQIADLKAYTEVKEQIIVKDIEDGKDSMQ